MQELHLTVAAVVEQQGRYLVVEESVDGRRVLNQPAGHVEPGETLHDAVVRETLEETAWHFTPTAITGVYLWQNPQTSASFLRVAFCGRCSDHEPGRPLDGEILRTVWLSRAELEQRHDRLRSPMVLRAIADYEGDVRLPVDSLRALGPEDLAARATVL
jgi:ADP-ribose pyrophosphatase YjhB (NUDIX family)